jgi:hypothetical protein
MEGWNLREEVLKSVHQWYLIVGLIVLGSLLGYVISLIVPAPYQAIADLYVGIDVVRVNEMDYLIPLAKEEPLNLDDYKNWQLKQVSDILHLDLVLEDTLNDLRLADPYWQDVSLNDFRESIDIYWYDTGIWRLQVTNADRTRAKLAVKTWLDNGHAKLSELLIVSEQAALLDAELQTIKEASAVQKRQIARLETFQNSSADWITRLGDLDQNQPVAADLRSEMLGWLQSYQEEPDLWQVSLNGFPDEGGKPAGYKAWLEQLQVPAGEVLEESQRQYQLMLDDREEILPDYHQALDDSLGLSANIVLLENTSEPQVDQVRHPGNTALFGGLLGLLLWMVIAVVRVQGKGHVQD